MTDREKFVADVAFKSGLVAGGGIAILAFLVGYAVGVIL